jgi:hypothetical protein
MDDRVGGERISSDDRASRRFTSGRVCNEPGCGTRLSIYNDGRYCALHEPMVTPRMRGKKIA